MKSCLRVVTAMSVLLVLLVFGHPAPAAVPEGEFAVENDDSVLTPAEHQKTFNDAIQKSLDQEKADQKTSASSRP